MVKDSRFCSRCLRFTRSHAKIFIMCGRFSQTFSFDDLLETFRVVNQIPLAARYNIAPSQEVAAIRQEKGDRVVSMLHWGLIPFWAKDRKIGYRTLNARAETAHKTPSFRAAFRGRRCLIPASGFYEWDKKEKTHQPYFIHRSDGNLIALAGLWERWEDQEEGEVIDSCTIVTTAAAEPVASLHDRMPVVLEEKDFDLWIDPGEHRVENLQSLLHPAAKGVLSMYPVSTFVNKAVNEGEKCIERVEIS